MENKNEQLDTLNQIRRLIERSSRLISLSGISGIAAGTVAILGTVITCIYLKTGIFEQAKGIIIAGDGPDSGSLAFIFATAIIVFILALGLVILFSSIKAKKKNIIFWDAMAKRFFINLFIFLFTGGMFCLILFHYGIYFLIVSAMLIFYGLALINVSKFTFNEIGQLGVIEILLGIFAAFVTEYPLLIWLIGFGFLHLIYGTYVYFKYEKT